MRYRQAQNLYLNILYHSKNGISKHHAVNEEVWPAIASVRHFGVSCLPGANLHCGYSFLLGIFCGLLQLPVTAKSTPITTVAYSIGRRVTCRLTSYGKDISMIELYFGAEEIFACRNQKVASGIQKVEREKVTIYII
jgi:hypothetical protein